jgi:hypothetical protein
LHWRALCRGTARTPHGRAWCSIAVPKTVGEVAALQLPCAGDKRQHVSQRPVRWTRRRGTPARGRRRRRGGRQDGGRRQEDAGKVVRDAYSSYVVQEAPRKNLTALRCKIRTSALGLRNFSPEPIIYRENIFSGG